MVLGFALDNAYYLHLGYDKNQILHIFITRMAMKKYTRETTRPFERVTAAQCDNLQGERQESLRKISGGSIIFLGELFLAALL